MRPPGSEARRAGKICRVNAAQIPTDLADLLERPLYGTLAVVGRKGGAQASPMWFEVVDGTLRFTHTSSREKFKALRLNPSMSFVVFDPESPTRYVEVRGELVESIGDPTGGFYQRLARRYGQTDPAAPADAADRVILVMSIDRVLGH